MTKVRDLIRSMPINIEGRNARRLVVAVAIILFFVDTFIKPLSLVGLGLVLLALSPWMVSFIKSLEVPGLLKIEVREELEKVGERAESSGLLAVPPAFGERPVYETIYAEDPTLSLAGLRIELERRFRDILDMLGLSDSVGNKHTTRMAVVEARNAGILSDEEASVIFDLLPLLNVAIHAKDYSREAADWAISIGPQILAGIDEKIEARRNAFQVAQD